MFQSSFRPARLPARAILVSLIALAGLTGSAVAQTYVLASPDTTLNSDGWALGSANMAGFRNAVTNTAYFGPSGTVNVSVTVNQLADVTTGTLGGVNGFMSPWWSLTQATTAFRTAVLTRFQSGMDLWLLEDGTAHSPFGPGLGIVEATADGSVSNGTAPFFLGPFGTATNTATDGEFQFFSAGSVAAANGLVGGTNLSGQITIAYWPRGTFSPTSGALLLFSDVDMISNAYADHYTSLDANGVMALNTMAWLAQGAIPEPGTYALLMGLALLAFAGVRRQIRRTN